MTGRKAGKCTNYGAGRAGKAGKEEANATDKEDFRPGNKAKKELGIHSPLQEAGIDKAEIRKLSRNLNLATWDKPAQACLASRIPYGNSINEAVLRRIENAESLLMKMGFSQVRVRDYNGFCRIEVPKDKISGLISRGKPIIDKLKKMGYNYVTVDLEGYRTGSMNEVNK